MALPAHQIKKQVDDVGGDIASTQDTDARCDSAIDETNGSQDALCHELPTKDDTAMRTVVLAGLGSKVVTIDEIKKAFEALGVEAAFIMRKQVDKKFMGVAHVELVDERALQHVVSEAHKIIIRFRTPAVMPLSEFNLLTPDEQAAFEGSKRTRGSKPCRFNDQCRVRNCNFSHPSGDLCSSYPVQCTNASECNCRHPALPMASSPGKPSNRAPCMNGDACHKLDCKFFHPGGLLCRYYKNCRHVSEGKECKYRHPTDSQPSISVASVPASASAATDATKELSQTNSPMDSDTAKRSSNRRTPPKPKPGTPRSKTEKNKWAFQSSVNRVLHLHDKVIFNEIKKVSDEMNAALGTDRRDEMTRRAMQAKLQELRDQRAVFVDITTRLKNGEVGGVPLSEPDRMKVLKRELYRFSARLPALAKRLEIESHLSSMRTRFTVIQGQTGSGKSTQIPQYAADLPCFAGKRVICSQPRKLAATSLAAHVAFEYSGGSDWAKPGGDVGFRVGGHVKVSARTRIEYVTEAVLLDMIARARRDSGENPFEDVGCVIVDEAHERSITCDLIMGSLKENHNKWRHVKVAITSATIDIDLFSGFFDNAPIVAIPGRMFPVDIEYVNARGQESGIIDATKVATVVAMEAFVIQSAFPDPVDGDILCFLPGQDDVLRAKDMFEAMIARQLKTASPEDRAFLKRVQAHALFGKQDPDEQAQVFKKQTDRKVIFSTDVAETSVTIDGVVFVVDSGLRKAMVYDPVRNMSSLKVHTVSRSSAVQRCGRAGRTRPGRCFRLYSKEEFDEMEIGNTAEIFQQPLTLALLTLYNVGIDPREFQWIEAPSAEAIDQAEAELKYLCAVDEYGKVTQLGRLIAEVQVDPKHVRLIDRAAQMGLVHVGVDLVAVLSVAKDAYYRGKKDDTASKEEANKKRDAWKLPEQGDVVSLFRTYQAYKGVLEGYEDKPGSAKETAPSQEPVAEDMNDVEDDNCGEMIEFGVEEQERILTMRAVAAASKDAAANNQLDGINDDDANCGDDESKIDPFSDISAVEDIDDEDEDDEVATLRKAVMAHEAAKSAKKLRRKNNEKKARAWCLKNGVNSKAMGIAYSTAKDLRRVLVEAARKGFFREGESTSEPVTNEQLRRLLTSGFFLNAAVRKPMATKQFCRDGPQFFALYSGVLGPTRKFAALDLIEKRGDTVPSWILFDRIFRFGTTAYLEHATPVEESWIQEESQSFYDLCTARRAELPVETVDFGNLAFTVLRGIFGKGFHEVNRWEARLHCTFDIDFERGTLLAFCAPNHEVRVRAEVGTAISLKLQQLERDASEEVYMGSTRAIIGVGFRVHELLFDKEFVALSVRNIPAKNDHELEQLVLGWVSSAGCGGADAIRSIDTIRSTQKGTTSVSATIRFMSKKIAQSVYDLIHGETNGIVGESLVITQLCKQDDGSSGSAATAAEFSGRITVTWADGEPTGAAKVFFGTAESANQFVRTAREILSQPTLQAFADGAFRDKRDVQKSGDLPKIGRVTPRSNFKEKLEMPPTTKEPSSGLVLFDLEAITALSIEQLSRLRFAVYIKTGLPVSMDEFELSNKIRNSIPGVGDVRITRKPSVAKVVPTETELETRFNRLYPLLSHLDPSCTRTDFVDKTRRRVGEVVYCSDRTRLTEIYQSTRDSELWKDIEQPHGQPIRVALEHTYTTSIHSDIRQCFRDQIARVIANARASGVYVTESAPKLFSRASPAAKNMVTFVFRGELRALQRVKVKLDECLESEKFESVDINLLFGAVARYKLAEITNDHIAADNAKIRYAIHWIMQKKGYWVYGDGSSRAYAISLLNNLIRSLKELEVVDHMIRIFVKKDNKASASTAKDIRQWIKTAPTARTLYYCSATTGKRLLVAGSQVQVAELTQALQKDGFLYLAPKWSGKKRSDDTAKPDCALCGDPAEDETVITLPICNHSLDLGCVEDRMIVPATCTFPVRCPGCAQPIRVDDVRQILNNADKFTSLVEVAAFQYASSHANEVVVCPKPGCNQLLSALAVTGSADSPGGRSVYCSQCCAYYCLECSNVAQKPVSRHRRQTCEQFRANEVSPVIMQHIRTIREQILNLTCPHCRTVFLDFEGCTSVVCGNSACGHHFCANCLEFSSLSSGETHEHVRRCPNNLSTEHGGIKSYWVSEEQLATTHRALRTQRIISYFRDQLASEPLRCAVYMRLSQDLADVCVELPVELQAGEASKEAAFTYGSFTKDDEAESQTDETVRLHLQHVREQLLNLRCPKCQAVFVDFDFDSCAALTCARPSCARAICAYCLADCGKDAHGHVSQCTKNPNRPYFYTTEAVFLAVHKERREDLVAQYLSDVVRVQDGAVMVQMVKDALLEDFRIIGLSMKVV